jgi:CubicO group peptidase (beta-lactamase class C family)
MLDLSDQKPDANPELEADLPGLKIEVEPGEAGFDAARLGRIDAYYRRYVDEGLLPGWLILVSRRGRIVHLSMYGQRDREAGLPVAPDTLWRIYSMSKPITSVAAMILYEEGAFDLNDPVSRFIPSFGSMRVYCSGSALKSVTVPAVEPVRIWHLLTHTSGLTYGYHRATAVDAMYRAAGFEIGCHPGKDLAANCEAWASLPLLFQPGSGWNYSVSIDVLGRVVEVISGQTLDVFLEERVFKPLGMTGTTFWVREADHHRLAALYTTAPDTGLAVRMEDAGRDARTRPTHLSGGGGLVSTAADYHRFTQMLLRGGELDGARLLGTRTLRYMTRNHLPSGADLEGFGCPRSTETLTPGVGFGLGFAVVQDNVKYKVLSSPGEFAWSGAASTTFWVDPVERITALFMTQLRPSGAYPLRARLRQLVYQALVD